VIGWKEFEMEVVRDAWTTASFVCSIENVDPMGIHRVIDHRGTRADPRQGIPDHARRLDRSAARDRPSTPAGRTCNSPSIRRRAHARDRDEPARLALLRPRVQGDRFPIAKVAAKLAVGYTLDELRTRSRAGRRPRLRAEPSTTSSPRCRASPSRISPRRTTG